MFRLAGPGSGVQPWSRGIGTTPAAHSGRAALRYRSTGRRGSLKSRGVATSCSLDEQDIISVMDQRNVSCK